MKKPKKPLTDYWYPRTPTKWRRKTARLTPHQEGLYLRLTDYYMETKEALPDDDFALARICGVSIADFEPHGALIRQFYTSEDGQLFNKTCEENLDAESGEHARRMTRASKAANARWKKEREKSKGSDEAECLGDAKSMLGDATEQNRTEEKKDSILKKDITSLHSPVSAQSANADARALVPSENIDEAVGLYNTTATAIGIPLCQTLSDKRRKALKARLKEAGGMAGWIVAMEKLAASNFLRGGSSSGWMADFDFVLQQKSFTKLMEGSYDNRKPTANNPNKQLSSHDALFAGFAQADVGE